MSRTGGSYLVKGRVSVGQSIFGGLKIVVHNMICSFVVHIRPVFNYRLGFRSIPRIEASTGDIH